MVSSYCWKSWHFRKLEGSQNSGKSFLFPNARQYGHWYDKVNNRIQSRQLIPGSKRTVRKFSGPEKQRPSFSYMPDKRMAKERGWQRRFIYSPLGGHFKMLTQQGFSQVRSTNFLPFSFLVSEDGLTALWKQRHATLVSQRGRTVSLS
jgi:hypothetical protein